MLGQTERILRLRPCTKPKRLTRRPNSSLERTTLHTSGRHRAAIEIGSMRVLEGKLPPRALGLVVEWASQHNDELMRNWEAARNNRPLRKIDPLT
ncbi:MAG: DUF4160 domain-containing protein [Desulfomonilaceae bacterium]